MATKKNKKGLRKHADAWFFFTVVICLTGRIYEHFAHGVVSYSMIYAFAYPLILGCLVNMLFIYIPFYLQPGHFTNSVYSCSIITLTVGSLLEGVFDIYGTVSKYIKYYYIVGAALLVVALVLFIYGLYRAQEEW